MPPPTSSRQSKHDAARQAAIRERLRAAGLSERAAAGRLLAGVASLLLPVFLFLPYATAPGATATGWETLDSSDIIMTVSSLAVVVLLATELLVQPSRTLVVAVACCCCFSLGLAWPDFLGIGLTWGAGAVLTLVTALAACAGAVVAVAEPVASRPLLASVGPAR